MLRNRREDPLLAVPPSQAITTVVKKLDAIKESNGASILDNSLIAYGCGNSDGNRHNHDNLPTLLLGKGGGTVNPGRHQSFEGAPVTNLWLSMLDRVGAKVESLGDSSGRLKGLIS